MKILLVASDYADHIVLKEYTINQQKDDIMRDIYLEHPDVVCVSCYIWNLSFVKELMADLIKILPGADFWAGGPEVSYDAEKFLTENSEFKGVMVGEGTCRILCGKKSAGSERYDRNLLQRRRSDHT